MAGGHNSILHSEDDDLIAYDDFSAIFQMILRILSIIRTIYICMCFYSKSLRNMLINRVWSVRKSTAIKSKDDLVIVQEYICSSVVYIDRKDF